MRPASSATGWPPHRAKKMKLNMRAGLPGCFGEKWLSSPISACEKKSPLCPVPAHGHTAPTHRRAGRRARGDPDSLRLSGDRFAVSGMDMEEGLDAKRGAAVDGLPDDVLVEILSRVPARSIHRFKCVSKPWRNLIADPLHRKRLPQTLEGFFCSDGAGFRGSFISLPGRSAPPVDPSFSFLTKLPGLIKVLGSCNGLLLFEYGWNPATAYAVWNPATEEWVAVPSAGRPSHDPVLEERTYLIFDPAVSPHFHLLYIWQKDFLCEIEVRTYSSDTRVWSDRASQQRRWQDEGEWKQWVNNGGAILISTGACVNGMVHLIIFNMLDEYLIAMFDREGKTCRVIRWPDNCASPLFVGQSQGGLHCVGLLVEREESCLKWAGLCIWENGF